MRVMIKTSITGKIKQIGSKQDITETFSKKRLLLDTNDDYNPLVCVDFFNGKIDLLESFTEGMEVTVYVDIYSVESKKVKNQFFNNITGWKVEASAKDNRNNLGTVDLLQELKPEPDAQDLECDLPF